MDMAAMAKMLELAQPGPEHEELAKTAGTWDMDYSMWMMPDAPPLKASGESKTEMVLGGRWLYNDASGEMMGSKTQSIGYLGYDRRTEEYVTVGLDTMGTYFITASGEKGEDGVIRMHGVDDSPMGKQVYTFEMEFPSEDEQILRLYFSEMSGQTFDPPFKLMEYTATRSK